MLPIAVALLALGLRRYYHQAGRKDIEMSDEISETREAFLTGNARPQYIAQLLADVLRDLMRATSAKSDYTGAVGRATENWEVLLELLKRCKEPLSWRRLFYNAVEMLRPKEAAGDIESAMQEIARAGMSYYVEGGPRGVIGKKRDLLWQAIQHLELRRE